MSDTSWEKWVELPQFYWNGVTIDVSFRSLEPTFEIIFYNIHSEPLVSLRFWLDGDTFYAVPYTLKDESGNGGGIEGERICATEALTCPQPIEPGVEAGTNKVRVVFTGSILEISINGQYLGQLDAPILLDPNAKLVEGIWNPGEGARSVRFRANEGATIEKMTLRSKISPWVWATFGVSLGALALSGILAAVS